MLKMNNNKDVFKKSFKDAFAKETLNADSMKDFGQFMGGLKEDDDIEDIKGNDKDMVDGVIDIVKKVKDIKNRKTIAKDMITKFKKEKVKFDYDEFLKAVGLKKKNKVENKEATGSGSSGAYSAPLFSGEEPVNEEVEKVEATEATGSGSSGAYETPAMWAKTTKKKDWGPSRKTQYKGGSFVSVKKKCTKFPYCNQGDIKALNLYKNESVKEAITKVAKKLNVNETTIKAILEYEVEKISKITK